MKRQQCKTGGEEFSNNNINLTFTKISNNLATIHVLNGNIKNDIKAVVFDDKQILAIKRANSKEQTVL